MHNAVTQKGGFVTDFFASGSDGFVRFFGLKKCNVLNMVFNLNLSCLLTAASVGVSTGLIVYYFGLKKEKNEKEVVVTAEDIYQYNSIDKVAIDAGGTDVILYLSISAEEKLRKLLDKRKKSSLLYT